jgi:hypothetical protein
MISEFQLTKLFQKIKALNKTNPKFVEALDIMIDISFKLNIKITELDGQYLNYSKKHLYDEHNIEGD